MMYDRRTSSLSRSWARSWLECFKYCSINHQPSVKFPHTWGWKIEVSWSAYESYFEHCMLLCTIAKPIWDTVVSTLPLHSWFWSLDCRSKGNQLCLIFDAILLNNPLLHCGVNQNVLTVVVVVVVHGNCLYEKSIFNKYLAFLILLCLNDDLSFVSILNNCPS